MKGYTRYFSRHKGSTLIETLLAIFIIGIAVLAFGALSQYVKVNIEVKRKAAAYNLATEELEAVRALGYTAIENRNDSTPTVFINVTPPFGEWSVASPGYAATGVNVYDIASRGSSATGITGFAPIPSPTNFATTFSAFTIEAKVRVASDSPRNDWGAGLAFRYRDSAMQYQYILKHDSLTLLRTVMAGNGTTATTTMYSGTPAINTDTWYTLRVRMTDVASNNLQLYLNGVVVYTGTDATIARGELGLIALNSAHASFDAVRIATNTSNVPPTEPTWDITWNYDLGETLGSNARGWGRFGLNDLPNTTPNIANDNGALSITNYNGNANLKNVSATVNYLTSSGVRSVLLTTLMSRYGTAQ